MEVEKRLPLQESSKSPPRKMEVDERDLAERSKSKSHSHSRSRSRVPSRSPSQSRSRSRGGRSRSIERSGPKRLSRSRSRSHSRPRSPVQRRSPSPRGRGRSGKPIPNPKPSSVLGVFGLSNMTRQRDLEDIFSKYGSLKEAVLVSDRRTNQSRGFGFIYFDRMEDAEKALKETNGMRLDGRYIRVDFSATARPHSPTPGHYMGERRERSRDRRYGSGRDSYRRRHYRSRSPARRSRSRDRYRRDSRDRRDRRYSRSRSR